MSHDGASAGFAPSSVVTPGTSRMTLVTVPVAVYLLADEVPQQTASVIATAASPAT